MAKQKNTIIYHSHFELMDSLSDEQAGKLIKAIGRFNSGLEVLIDDRMVLGIFTAIKRDFILQAENYEKKVKANRENGSKGGRPKVTQSKPKGNPMETQLKPTITEDNPQNPMGYLETQPNPQNLKDKDKDKEKDKDIKKESNSISLEANEASGTDTSTSFFENSESKLDYEFLKNQKRQQQLISPKVFDELFSDVLTTH